MIWIKTNPKRNQGSGDPYYQSKEWKQLRKPVIQRDKGLCQQCKREGRTKPGNTVDHIVSRRQGGADSLNNLELLCRRCHDKKRGKEGHDRGGNTEGH